MKGLLLVFALALGAALADERIVLLLDTSGSMRGQERAMVEAVNAVLSNMTDTLLRATPHWNGTFDVQIYLFSGGSVWSDEQENGGRRLLLEAPLHSRPQIALEHYVCDGGTPLYDVLGDTLSALAPGSTLVVATDGEDTTSQRWSNKQVLALVNATTLKERDIHLIYVYKGVEAEREAVVGLGMASVASSGSGSIAIGHSFINVGAAFQLTFTDFGGTAATFRHIVTE